MRIDKNSPCNISRFKIDASKFNSTMDRLSIIYSIPKKVTEFERKVGRSVLAALTAIFEWQEEGGWVCVSWSWIREVMRINIFSAISMF